MQIINACILFLQITLLSETVLSNGKEIKTNILTGKYNSNESTKLWPRQKSPDAATCKMWRLFLRKTFCSNDNHLQSNFKLGPLNYSASQLSRKYGFLYSSALEEISQIKGNTIVNWFAKQKGRQRIIRNLDSQDTSSSVLEDVYQIRVSRATLSTLCEVLRIRQLIINQCS